MTPAGTKPARARKQFQNSHCTNPDGGTYSDVKPGTTAPKPDTSNHYDCMPKLLESAHSVHPPLGRPAQLVTGLRGRQGPDLEPGIDVLLGLFWDLFVWRLRVSQVQGLEGFLGRGSLVQASG